VIRKACGDCVRKCGKASHTLINILPGWTRARRNQLALLAVVEPISVGGKEKEVLMRKQLIAGAVAAALATTMTTSAMAGHGGGGGGGGHGGGGGGFHGGGGFGGFHGGGGGAFRSGGFQSGGVRSFAATPGAGFSGVHSGAVRGSFAAIPAGAGVVAGHSWAGHGWNGHGWHHGHRHFVRAFGVGGYGYYDDGYYGDPADYYGYTQGTCSSYYYDENGNTYCADGGTSFNAVGW
jgi:hypothetical protein